MTPVRAAVLCVLAAAPAVAVTIGLLVFAGLEVSGPTPLSYGPPQNIAEAAVTGQAAAVLRFLREGQDPAREWTLRREIAPRYARATGLEAAVLSGQGPLVALIERRGAIPDASTRRHLACLASDLTMVEVGRYLSPGGPPRCEPGEALALVRARANQP